MKKSNIIISAVVGFILLLFGIIMLIGQKDNSYSTINLEINPSIEIKFEKEKVISVEALNDDAKIIVNNDFKGKSLDETFKIILESLIDNGYVKENKVTMLMHVSSDLDGKEINNKMNSVFKDKGIYADTIIIDKVSKDDEEFAKNHNISPYKAAYLNTIKENFEYADIEKLVDKPISELKETKDTGNLCEEGYTLERDLCFKEIERIEAKQGNVCPGNYDDYNGKCYENTPYIEGPNYVCNEDFTLKDGMCYREETYLAEPICENGIYHGEDDSCYEQVYIGDAYEYCRDPGRTLYNHKCLATKPTINGGCLNGDMLYNGKCVNTRNDYYDSEWKCPDGQTNSKPNGELINSDNKCYQEKKGGSPTYSCQEEYKLNGKTCVREEMHNAEKERICPSGFTKVEYDRCINMNNVKEYETGLVCDKENARVENGICVVYDIKPATHNN